MKYSELEDGERLAGREWVEQRLASFKTDLNLERLKRESKLMNCAGLIVLGLTWGFAIAMIFLSHK